MTGKHVLPDAGTVYAVLFGGRWHIAIKVRAGSYGAAAVRDLRLHPNQFVFSERDTTMFLCEVPEADKVVKLQ